jgi:hypothetical protein
MTSKNPNDSLARYQMEDIEELLRRHQNRKRVQKAFTIKVSLPPLETCAEYRLNDVKRDPDGTTTRLARSVLKSSKTMQIRERQASTEKCAQFLNLKGAGDAI